MSERLLKIFVSGLFVSLDRIISLRRSVKMMIALMFDLILCVIAVWIAYLLRTDSTLLISSPGLWFIIATIGFWIPIAFNFKIYRIIFRVSGAGTIISLANATLFLSLPLISIFMIIQVPGIPRTLAVLHPIVFFLLLALSRITARYILTDILKYRGGLPQRKRALIYGAGSAGRQLAASLQHEPTMDFVGYIDDDHRLVGQRIDGKVILKAREISQIVESYKITDVLLTMPRITPTRRKAIIKLLSEHPVHVKTLPTLREIVDGTVSVSALREVDVADLLGRDPVAPNFDLLCCTITDKIVMVTGAGGSIGSELCRQILRLKPHSIILLEMSEFSLYAIDSEMRAMCSGEGLNGISIRVELANLADRATIARIMQRYNPQTVFHAAAYKHVPLVEANPIGATRNNVLGMYHTALAAVSVGVEYFVLISTDKAVRPTNIMGATKRICELILQAIAHRGAKTVFSMVRFGNVLGSSGSVVPLFKRQIAAGGPVTVTDKRITRYFMTIPEAAELVIQAGAMAKGGEVFVLDMGKPIKILDLARTMIRLSGFTEKDAENPDGEIEITEIGLRPGEKLYEELLINDAPKKTSHERIMQAHESFLPFDELSNVLDRLLTLIGEGDREGVVDIISQLVPEYGAAKEDGEDGQ